MDASFIAIPNFRTVLPDPDGNKVGTLIWDVDNGPNYLGVECVNPGADGTYTYGIHVKNAQIVTYKEDVFGSESTDLAGGQLLQGDKAVFFVTIR